MVSALTEQEFNHSQLGREIGIAPKTAQRWLGMLRATHLRVGKGLMLRATEQPQRISQDMLALPWNLL